MLRLLLNENNSTVWFDGTSVHVIHMALTLLDDIITCGSQGSHSGG